MPGPTGVGHGTTGRQQRSTLHPRRLGHPRTPNAMLFHSRAQSIPLEWLPDNLTSAQFMLDSEHQLRGRLPPDDPWSEPYIPVPYPTGAMLTRSSSTPRFIDSTTGRSYSFKQTKERVAGLANALARRGLGTSGHGTEGYPRPLIGETK